MSAALKVTRALVSAPLPTMIERLGIAIAEAQAALDKNSVAVAQKMAASEVDIMGETHNLLSLGFMPSFYAFTEATVEAKMAFSVTETQSFSVGASASVQVGVFAASVDASYSRKFSVSAEGSSSIAARIVALPPPEIFTSILQRHLNDTEKSPKDN